MITTWSKKNTKCDIMLKKQQRCSQSIPMGGGKNKILGGAINF